MASGFDDVTPHLNLKEHWHREFDEIFQDFRPDEWSLEPTNTYLPQAEGWQSFKDGAKVKFCCECGNGWTSMAGIVIFWFKKIEDSERRKEAKKNGENGESKEGKNGEDRKDSGNTSANDTRNRYSLRFKLYGQQCRRCDNDDFQNPRWYREEITKVLKNVHQKIGEMFYNFPSGETDNTKRRGRPRGEHDSKRCQACKEGHCRR